MKVVAFNGSARKDGNTAMLVRQVFEPLEAKGVECEMIQLAGKMVRGCTACGSCRKNKNERCIIDSDPVNDYIAKMIEADGMILASPVYFSDITPELKASIDRSGYVGRGNDHVYKRKVGAAVTAVRRTGSLHALDTIDHFFSINQMIMPGSSYWALGIGGPKGAVEQDTEGMQAMKTLGENMAWLLEKLA
ncbi:MAG: flavodoxin family protein [bacterium]|nr:flavodoxin family protein [bacterium]